ncbi:DUF6879 family protein [Streptomyces phytohabitans]|uniref:DUF6879 family protein n=1 Tax=Streptomyces phytohabitans TaxID=1150371 RepID=UPI00345B7926
MPSSVPGFAELLGRCHRSAVHLELRDSYAATDRFEAWQRGERIDWDDRESWWHPCDQLVADTVARGVVIRRARVISEPVSDHIRWEHYVTRANVTAGEEVRWLPRRQATTVALPGNDFWLFDDALLSSIADFRGTPDDVSDAVAARMRRNAVLSSGAHRFSFVLEESVLRHRLCGSETMAAQLGHLLGAMDLQNVAVGIVPFSAQRTAWPMPTLTIFDDGRVHADTLDAAATLTQPGQVELYARAFERLSREAARGAAARALIAEAVASLG